MIIGGFSTVTATVRTVYWIAGTLAYVRLRGLVAGTVKYLWWALLV